MKTLSTHSKQSVTAGRELHRVATLEQRVGKENTIKKDPNAIITVIIMVLVITTIVYRSPASGEGR